MELDHDGPFTKWKSKNGNRFQLQLLLLRCYWIPLTMHREAIKRPLIIFMYRNSVTCSVYTITFIGQIRTSSHFYRTQQKSRYIRRRINCRLGGVCGDYNANFSIVGRVVLLHAAQLRYLDMSKDIY